MTFHGNSYLPACCVLGWWKWKQPTCWLDGFATYSKFKPAKIKIGNVPCSLPRNELIVHNDTFSTSLNMCDQIITTLFHNYIVFTSQKELTNHVLVKRHDATLLFTSIPWPLQHNMFVEYIINFENSISTNELLPNISSDSLISGKKHFWNYYFWNFQQVT